MIPARALWTAFFVAAVGAMILVGTGCATVYTPPGATTAQKMKDDLSAIGQVEADVKAQCGPQFASLGATAMAILSVAEAVGDIAAYNIGGAVQAAIAALPAVVADVKGMTCVVSVIRTDYAKLKPKAAPPATTPSAPPVSAKPAPSSASRAVRWDEHTRFAAALAVWNINADCKDATGYYAPAVGDEGLPVGSVRTDGRCVEGERAVVGGRLHFAAKVGGCAMSVIACTWQHVTR